MTDIVANDAVMALIQVVMINLVLSGDNAVVIGLAAAGLPAKQRTRAITIGILIATALRITFASVATQLLQVFGLLLAGGILLLWVCWKMWRELQTTPQDQQGGGERLVAYAPGGSRTVAGSFGHKTFGRATLQIVVADVSMSLDNVLAIAGAARDQPVVLAFGPVRCADGRRSRSDSSLTQQAPLDRLCRARNCSLCGLRNDLPRRLRAEVGDELAGVMLQ